ncbi:hypothetical protein [Kineococcus arenarius]|uniref:hypothetical protein n=1 Tax=unclassified Kineococcus TaxID=2621656 RepID=UPI003D7C5826
MPRRWVPAIPPDDTGVQAHGPLLLSEAPGIRAELDHVQAHAHPAGLMLHLNLHADGVPAQAAQRQLLDQPREPLDPAGGTADLGSQPVLHVTINDLADQVHAKQRSVRTHQDKSTGEVRLAMHARYWIAELPADAQVRLSISWPRAGLPHAEHTLTLLGNAGH